MKRPVLPRSATSAPGFKHPKSGDERCERKITWFKMFWFAFFSFFLIFPSVQVVQEASRFSIVFLHFFGGWGAAFGFVTEPKLGYFPYGAKCVL